MTEPRTRPIPVLKKIYILESWYDGTLHEYGVKLIYHQLAMFPFELGVNILHTVNHLIIGQRKYVVLKSHYYSFYTCEKLDFHFQLFIIM
jgi:hypothetical protein